VIMTSNLGTRLAKEGKSLGFQKRDEESSYEQMKEKITDELRKTFNPELLNRIDETIIFHPLNMEDILQIIDILLADVAKRLADKGISFSLTKEAREFLAQKGYNPAFGARPLRRAIQKYLEDPLAEEILGGQFAGDCEVLIDRKDEESLRFTINPTQKSSVEDDAEKSPLAKK